MHLSTFKKRKHSFKRKLHFTDFSETNHIQGGGGGRGEICQLMCKNIRVLPRSRKLQPWIVYRTGFKNVHMLLLCTLYSATGGHSRIFTAYKKQGLIFITGI